MIEDNKNLWVLFLLFGYFSVSLTGSSFPPYFLTSHFLRAQFLVLSSIYIHTFSDFSESHGFQCHLCAKNSKIYIF